MQRIEHPKEFEHGKRYKRVARGMERIVEIQIKNEIPYASDLTGDEWVVSLQGANYYHLNERQ